MNMLVSVTMPDLTRALRRLADGTGEARQSADTDPRQTASAAARALLDRLGAARDFKDEDG